MKKQIPPKSRALESYKNQNHQRPLGSVLRWLFRWLLFSSSNHRPACGIQLDSISGHDLRFSVASTLYKENIRPTELQMLLGHRTLQMTLHYLRLNTTIEETASKMCAIL